MERKFETRQCPCCERWFTPVHNRQITCGRLKCQAMRANAERYAMMDVRSMRQPLDTALDNLNALEADHG